MTKEKLGKEPSTTMQPYGVTITKLLLRTKQGKLSKDQTKRYTKTDWCFNYNNTKDQTYTKVNSPHTGDRRGTDLNLNRHETVRNQINSTAAKYRLKILNKITFDRLYYERAIPIWFQQGFRLFGFKLLHFHGSVFSVRDRGVRPVRSRRHQRRQIWEHHIV